MFSNYIEFILEIEHIVEFNNVDMINPLEELNLFFNIFYLWLIKFFNINLFNYTNKVSLSTSTLINFSINSLSNFFCNSVPFL